MLIVAFSLALVVVQAATSQKLACLTNTEVCSQCPADRRTEGLSVSCCPGCGEMVLSGEPLGHRGYSCHCHAFQRPVTDGNWTAASVEGKVLSGSRPPHVNSIVNKPSGGHDHRPVSDISQQFHAAITVLADAIENLALKLEKLEKKVDMYHQDGQYAGAESSSINRVGVADNKDKRKAEGGTTTEGPNSVDKKICPTDFVAIGNVCYYISVTHYERSVWKEASDDCLKRGAQLANLADFTNNKLLSEHLSSSTATAAYSFWLGGLYPGIKWIWVDTAAEVPLRRALWTYGSRSQLRSSLLPVKNPATKSVSSGADSKGSPNIPMLLSVMSTRSDVGISSGNAKNGRRDDSATPSDDPLNWSAETKSARNLHRDSRAGNPWDVLYGRCLLFHPTETAGGRTFKYAASPCGYRQYYICQVQQ